MDSPEQKQCKTQLPEANHWNDKLENAVKDIGETSKGYKLMHIKEAQHSIKIYNRLMIVGIVMGPLAGIISGIGASINVETTDPTIPIIATIFGFISGIAVTIIKFGKYDESSNASKQAAARYTSIESNVRRQLGLYRSDRVPATPYMEWLENKYEELFLSAPLIPAGVYDNYLKTSMKLGLCVPNQYNSVITINTEYENAKIDEIKNRSVIEVNTSSIEENIPIAIISPRADSVMAGDKTMKRSTSMLKFPEMNQCSDKMLAYELGRMFRKQ